MNSIIITTTRVFNINITITSSTVTIVKTLLFSPWPMFNAVSWVVSHDSKPFSSRKNWVYVVRVRETSNFCAAAWVKQLDPWEQISRLGHCGRSNWQTYDMPQQDCYLTNQHTMGQLSVPDLLSVCEFLYKTRIPLSETVSFLWPLLRKWVFEDSRKRVLPQIYR